MLQREWSRIGLCALVGALLGGLTARPLLPAALAGALYVIGLVYAGQMVLRMILWVLRTWFSYQMTSLIFKSLVGTLACSLLLSLGLSFALSVGWLAGLVRAVLALVRAAREDRALSQSYPDALSDDFSGFSHGFESFDSDHWDV